MGTCVSQQNEPLSIPNAFDDPYAWVWESGTTKDIMNVLPKEPQHLFRAIRRMRQLDTQEAHGPVRPSEADWFVLFGGLACLETYFQVYENYPPCSFADLWLCLDFLSGPIRGAMGRNSSWLETLNVVPFLEWLYHTQPSYTPPDRAERWKVSELDLISVCDFLYAKTFLGDEDPNKRFEEMARALEHLSVGKHSICLKRIAPGELSKVYSYLKHPNQWILWIARARSEFPSNIRMEIDTLVFCSYEKLARGSSYSEPLLLSEEERWKHFKQYNPTIQEEPELWGLFFHVNKCPFIATEMLQYFLKQILPLQSSKIETVTFLKQLAQHPAYSGLFFKECMEAYPEGSSYLVPFLQVFDEKTLDVRLFLDSESCRRTFFCLACSGARIPFLCTFVSLHRARLDIPKCVDALQDKPWISQDFRDELSLALMEKGLLPRVTKVREEEPIQTPKDETTKEEEKNTNNCPLCMDAFSSQRMPKILSCGHTFCAMCLADVYLRKAQGITCPLCRQIPLQKTYVDVPTNYLVSDLLQLP